MYINSIQNNKGELIKMLEENKEKNLMIKSKDIPQKEFFEFKSSSGKKLNFWMIKPQNFNENKSYPVLLDIYCGPGIQTVLDSWSYESLWHRMLAQKGFIVISIDTRGTGARGSDFEKEVYLELGVKENIDLQEFSHYLAKQKYIDSENIMIKGWSYGGFMVLKATSSEGNVFKSGISIAPLSDWRFYDTVFTERYMKTPKENNLGYNKSSVLDDCMNLKSKLLLIHGLADDNVHVQNSYEFLNSCIAANKQIDFFIYPNRNHSILGGNTRYHLYSKINIFLMTSLERE